MAPIPTRSVTSVIAAYNAERYVAQAVQSIRNQGEISAGIILCDDASTDGTPSVLARISMDDLHVLRNDVNLGPGPSRDRAIAMVRSQWIALVDADDSCAPYRFEKLLSAAMRTGADVIFDDTLLCHDTERELVPWQRLHGSRAFGTRGAAPQIVRVEDYLRAERLLVHPIIRTAFIRKSMVRHSTRRFGEDAEYYLRLAAAGARFCYVPEPLYYYRISPGSLTAQALDPTLMRRCLEECAEWDDWWPSAKMAFETKIASLRTNEALYTFARAIRSANFGDAARVIASEPRLLAILPRRLIRQFHYQAHRMIHGGRRR